jgi:hypothetical protein
MPLCRWLEPFFDDFDNGGGINMRGGPDYSDDNQDD